MSFIEKLHHAQAQLADRDADPLREKVGFIVRGMEAISTVALLDLGGPCKDNRQRPPDRCDDAVLRFYPDQITPPYAGRLPRQRNSGSGPTRSAEAVAAIARR